MKAIGLHRFSENSDRRNGGLELKLHSSNPEPLMSALGQKQTFASDQLMTALPQKRTSDPRLIYLVNTRSSPGTVRVSIPRWRCCTETAHAHFARQFFECRDPILNRWMGGE